MFAWTWARAESLERLGSKWRSLMPLALVYVRSHARWISLKGQYSRTHSAKAGPGRFEAGEAKRFSRPKRALLPIWWRLFGRINWRDKVSDDPRLDESVRRLTWNSRNTIAQQGCCRYSSVHNFFGRRGMRGDCRLNDAVHFVTVNFFTDRLFKIFNISKFCAGANAANRKSSDNNLWRQIGPSPDRHPYIRTQLACTWPGKKRTDRSQKLVRRCRRYAAGASHLNSTRQSIVAVCPTVS